LRPEGRPSGKALSSTACRAQPLSFSITVLAKLRAAVGSAVDNPGLAVRHQCRLGSFAAYLLSFPVAVCLLLVQELPIIAAQRLPITDMKHPA